MTDAFSEFTVEGERASAEFTVEGQTAFADFTVEDAPNIPPEVTITFPAADEVLNAGDFTLTGTALDIDGLLTAVTVNLRDITLAQTWSGTAWTGDDWYIPADYTIPEWELVNVPLAPGHLYRLTALVTDGELNATAEVEFSTAPAIGNNGQVTSGDSYDYNAPASNRPGHRILYGDLRTGKLYGELMPVGTVSWVRTLNESGTASIPIALDTILDDAFEWRQTAIWIEVEGTIRKGIIAQALTSIDLANNRATIVGPGILDYFEHRHINYSHTWTAPAVQIAREVLSVPANSLRVELDDATFGAPVTRSAVWTKQEPVAKFVADLVADSEGFDVVDRYHFADDGSPSAIWTPLRKSGRYTNLTFDLGVNCEHAGGSIDASAKIDKAIAVGAGNDADTPVASLTGYTNGAPFEARSSHSDITDPTILASRAALDLRRGSDVATRPVIRLLPGVDLDWYLGDRVGLRGGHGLYQPAGEYRIVQESTTLDSAQTITALSLAPLTLFE